MVSLVTFPSSEKFIRVVAISITRTEEHGHASFEYNHWVLHPMISGVLIGSWHEHVAAVLAFLGFQRHLIARIVLSVRAERNGCSDESG